MFQRECGQDYIWIAGEVELSSQATGHGMSCLFCRAFIFEASRRMPMKLQTIDLDVVGSKPTDRL